MDITLTLPEKIDHSLKVGDSIDFGDKFYSSAVQETVTVNVADKLGVKSETIFRYLTKIIGENVSKGELLASKKGMLTTKKIHAPVSGVIREISHASGSILLSKTEASLAKNGATVRAQFRGKIKETKQNLLVVSVENAKRIELKTVTADGYGQVFYFTDESFYFTSHEREINEKVIVISELKSHIAVKCEALGAQSFLYLATKMQQDIPSAAFATVADYDTIIHLKRNNVIFSKHDKIALFYD